MGLVLERIYISWIEYIDGGDVMEAYYNGEELLFTDLYTYSRNQCLLVIPNSALIAVI